MLWSTKVNLSLVFEHIYFITNIHSNVFNGVIWSLIHELRISIIFPFVVLLIKRINWKLAILSCVALSSIASLNIVNNFQVPNGYNISYFDTIHYTSLFVLGALLSQHRKIILDIYRRKSPFLKWGLFIVSFLLYNLSEVIISYLYKITRIEFISTFFWIIVEYGVAIGCIGLIITAVGSYRIGRLLLFKPLVLLGSISYSLYLYHLPVILGCIYLLHKILPLWLICLLAILLSVILAKISWVLIEKRCIRIGKRIGEKLNNKPGLLNPKKIKGSA